MINRPFRAPWLGPPGWITVPPQTYGGIQWVVANLIDGLLALGHEVILLGAPGSPSQQGLTVLQAGTSADIRNWLYSNRHAYDVVHDHTTGDVFASDDRPPAPYVATWHMTGRDRYPCNAIYLSHSQRRQADCEGHPVVRIPVNPARYPEIPHGGDYLLFLGRVSKWKGAFEAALFAERSGYRLLIAGPCWEPDYCAQIERACGTVAEFLGEVGGPRRLSLLQQARALLVLSQPVDGPWGQQWQEPGATVVSEAAACGTPIIASKNGCLPELIDGVGVLIDEGDPPQAAACRRLVAALPSAVSIRETAVRLWSHTLIAGQYVEHYCRALNGERW